MENLYCTLSARQLNPDIYIVVTSDDQGAEQKFRHAGADSVVYTAVIGGQRIASELIRPEVVSFLDLMLRDPEHTFRFEQIALPSDSPLRGKTLAQAGLRKVAEVLVVAIKAQGTTRFTYNPGPDRRLDGGDLLVVLGDTGEIHKTRQFFADAEN